MVGAVDFARVNIGMCVVVDMSCRPWTASSLNSKNFIEFFDFEEVEKVSRVRDWTCVCAYTDSHSRQLCTANQLLCPRSRLTVPRPRATGGGHAHHRKAEDEHAGVRAFRGNIFVFRHGVPSRLCATLPA